MDKQYRAVVKVCEKNVMTIQKKLDTNADSNTKRIVATLQRVTTGLLIYTELLTSGTRQFESRAAALTEMKRVRPLLLAFNRLKTQIVMNKHLQAVELIREIERKMLPASRLYVHARVINGLQQLKRQIQRTSFSVFKDFMSRMKERTCLLGLQYDDVNDQDNAINLTPLITCWKLHKSLMLHERFKQIYQRQRELHLEWLLVFPNVVETSPIIYKTYLYSVFSFFVIEYQTWDSHKDLVSTEWLFNLFKTTQVKLKLHLDKPLQPVYCEEFNLPPNRSYTYFDLIRRQLRGPMQNMARLFHHVILFRCANQFSILVRVRHPLQLVMENTHNELCARRIIVQDDDDVQELPPPSARNVCTQEYHYRFENSPMVPAIQQHAEDIMAEFLEYSNLYFSLTKRINVTQHTICSLLDEKLSFFLSALLSDRSLPMDRLCQIAVDTLYLEDVATELFDTIKSYGETEFTGHPNPENLFQPVRDDVYRRMSKVVIAKTDECFPRDMHTWMLTRSGSINGTSRPVANYISWLLTFHNTLSRFICREAYPDIAQRMSEMIEVSTVEGISNSTLEQCKADTTALEEFATERSWHELPSVFQSLKELVNSVLESNFNDQLMNEVEEIL